MSADRKETMTCQGAPAPPLEDDNILSKILRRLPPLPSSLPRVSLVCRRWCCLVTHPHFHRSFLAHHKKAPLLGFFCSDKSGRIDFRPALGPPNRIPASHFSSSLLSEDNRTLGGLHGRLLLLNHCSSKQQHLVIWDPITGDRLYVDIPQMFQANKDFGRHAEVVCASREKDHVHGACHLEPFQVVLIRCCGEGVLACVYSSETCTWGNLISLLQPQVPDRITQLPAPGDPQSSLVGNFVYWVSVGLRGAVVEFDLHSQSLAIIDAPTDPPNFNASMFQRRQSFILPADGGGVSYILLSGLSLHVWKGISNVHGVIGWLFKNTVELSYLLSLKVWSCTMSDRICIEGNLKIVGHDEDDNVIFRSLRDNGTVYLVHLKTLQFKKNAKKIGDSIVAAHPFSSFYTAGNKWQKEDG